MAGALLAAVFFCGVGGGDEVAKHWLLSGVAGTRRRALMLVRLEICGIGGGDAGDGGLYSDLYCEGILECGLMGVGVCRCVSVSSVSSGTLCRRAIFVRWM